MNAFEFQARALTDCHDCGASLTRTPNAATRVEDGPDGPRCDLLECPDPQCGFAEAVEP